MSGALVAIDVALAALVFALAFSGERDRRGVRTARVAAWALAAVVAALVAGQLAVVDGVRVLSSTVTGRLLLVRLLATLAVLPVVFGLVSRPRLRRVYASAALPREP